MRVYDIRGIEADTADRLVAAGVKSAETLLEMGRTQAGRSDLAVRTGVNAASILELVNRADLSRIRGIGEVYSNLLENAGVDTVLELSKRVATHLHAKLLAQTQQGDARRAPTLAQVQDWITQARSLGRAVEY